MFIVVVVFVVVVFHHTTIFFIYYIQFSFPISFMTHMYALKSFLGKILKFPTELPIALDMILYIFFLALDNFICRIKKRSRF